MLDAVTPLLRVVRSLRPYARTTTHVSAQARAIRTALLTARAPDELLFESLPRACGIEPFSAELPAAPEQIDVFFTALREGLEELRAAYSHLSANVATRIGTAFLVATNDTTAMRDELLTRYHQIAAHTGTPKYALWVYASNTPTQGRVGSKALPRLLVISHSMPGVMPK